MYFACMYVYYHMHACAQEGQKRMLDPSELFLWVLVGHHACAEI